ncbi:hypothetical protein L3V83_06455 [Thiotrichales bacterium 19X7-9]|nr:hypothetical protein [Thiotrichales bacterium 19X7-9]
MTEDRRKKRLENLLKELKKNSALKEDEKTKVISDYEKLAKEIEHIESEINNIKENHEKVDDKDKKIDELTHSLKEKEAEILKLENKGIKPIFEKYCSKKDNKGNDLFCRVLEAQDDQSKNSALLNFQQHIKKQGEESSNDYKKTVGNCLEFGTIGLVIAVMYKLFSETSKNKDNTQKMDKLIDSFLYSNKVDDVKNPFMLFDKKGVDIDNGSNHSYNQ